MKKISIFVPVLSISLLLGTPFSVFAVEWDVLWSQMQDPTSLGDVATSMDIYGSDMYVSAFQNASPASGQNSSWLIERIPLSNGAPVTRTINPTGVNDRTWDIHVNSTGVYVVGFQNVTTTAGAGETKRIQKLDLNLNPVWNVVLGAGSITGVAGDTTGIYVIDRLGLVQKRSTVDGNIVLWSHPSSGSSFWSAIFSDATGVYTARDNGVIEKLSLTDGTPVWTKPGGGRFFHISKIGSDLYVAGHNSAQTRGYLEKRDAITGDPIWPAGKTSANLWLYRGNVSANSSAVYAVGQTIGSYAWGIEKLDPATGNFVSSKTDASGAIYGSGIDDTGLYAVGVQGGQLRIEKREIAPQNCGLTPPDADGTKYNTVVIGTQCWMKENMRVGTMINSSVAQTNNGTIEKYCYNNDSNNCTTNHPNYPDGGLYTWDEAMQYSTTEGAQGICPAGWHVPKDSEWHELEKYLKDTGQNCNQNRTGFECASAGAKLKPGGLSGFELNLAGIYSFISGFSMLSLDERNIGGLLWSSSESGIYAWSRYVGSSGFPVSSVVNTVFRGVTNKPNATPVRCVQSVGAVPPANILQLCRDGVPVAQGGERYDFSLPIGNHTNIKAYYDSDVTLGNQCDAGSTDVTDSVTFTEDNPTGGALSLSGSGTNPRIFTGTSSGTESFTIEEPGGQKITGTVTVAPVTPSCSSCNDEKAQHCPTETWINGCGDTCDPGGSDAGTRYCDFNWKEVRPGQ